MEHTVAGYDRDLADLETTISRMAGLAEAMLASSAKAIMREDHGLAERVVLSDEQLDRMDREVERSVITLIARRQPLAEDLRRIVATLKIAAELERIGDLARGIAARSRDMDRAVPPGVMVRFSHLVQMVTGRLSTVVDAYLARDDGRAVSVWLKDKEIDALYTAMFRDLISFMMEDPRVIGPCIQLMICAKNAERVGDHATNIAEIVHYVVTGDLLALDRPKGDDAAYAPLSSHLRPH